MDKWGGKYKSCCLALLEEKFKKVYCTSTKNWSLIYSLLASLIYNSKSWTKKKKKKYGGCFMEVSQPPDTASHIMVSASRIIEKLEIAYCMCLCFWTLGFWPNVAEKLLVRWYQLCFDLALLRSLDWNMIICVDVPEAGPLCGHLFWTKKGSMVKPEHQDVEVTTGRWVPFAQDLGV